MVSFCINHDLPLILNPPQCGNNRHKLKNNKFYNSKRTWNKNKWWHNSNEIIFQNIILQWRLLFQLYVKCTKENNKSHSPTLWPLQRGCKKKIETLRSGSDYEKTKSEWMNELSVAFVSLFIFYFWSLKLITIWRRNPCMGH
jgi:hypothetical protein